MLERKTREAAGEGSTEVQAWMRAAPLLVKQARYVMREMDPVAMRPMLERTVKGALLTNLLFVLGIFLSQWAA